MAASYPRPSNREAREAAPVRGTYICDHDGPCGRPAWLRPRHDSHCWHEHTDARLLWLYGEEGRAAREAATHADVAAWRALGTRRAA